MSIDKLSVELLIAIFEDVQQQETKPEHSTRCSPQWRVIRQVCRHWHDIADDHPKLWQAVDVLPSKHALDWVNLCLSKSGTAGLELRFHAPHAMREVCDALYAHAERIQKISAWGEETIRGLHALRRLFLLNLPNVQELHFHFDDNLPWARDIYALDTRFVLTELLGELSPARLPALHTISLRGIFLPWQSPRVIRSLRVLRVDRWEENPAVFHEPYDVPSDRFLHVLASCPKLEMLSLDVMNTHTHLRSPRHHGTLPVVALPALRRLALKVNHFESRALFVPLLAHIRPAFSCHTGADEGGAELRLAVKDGREEQRRAPPHPDEALARFCEYMKEAPRLARLTLCACVSKEAYAGPRGCGGAGRRVPGAAKEGGRAGTFVCAREES